MEWLQAIAGLACGWLMMEWMIRRLSRWLEERD